MSYQITHHVQNDVLYVEIASERQRETLVEHEQAAWRSVAQVCAEEGLEKILMISTATGSYPTLEAYEINANLDALGVKRGWKIAYVSLDPDTFDNMKFAETVAVNRGIDLKVFDNKPQAWKWLVG